MDLLPPPMLAISLVLSLCSTFPPSTRCSQLFGDVVRLTRCGQAQGMLHLLMLMRARHAPATGVRRRTCVVAGAVQFDQSDFRRTEKPDRDPGRAYPCARVALQVLIFPHPARVFAGAVGTGDHGANQRQTDLPAMRMAAEIQVNAALLCLLEDLRCMHQQDLEGIGRHPPEGSRKIITAIIVRVINADEPDALS